MIRAAHFLFPCLVTLTSACGGELDGAALPASTAPAAEEWAERFAATSASDVEAPAAALTAALPAALELADAGWRERIARERALADEDPSCFPRRVDGALVLSTLGGAVATFDQTAHLSIGGRDATLRVVSLSRPGGVRTPLPWWGSPSAEGAEVHIDRGAGVVEWWRALASGIEHGVTLGERPAGDGELSIELELAGDLRARLTGPDAVALLDEAGAHVATYAHLVVLDASGALLPARMSVGERGIELCIDDRGARYPIVVDPLVTAQEAVLFAPDAADGDAYGTPVSLSPDGVRALVGVPADDVGGVANAGSARVQLRTGAAWAEEATLTAPDRAMNDGFGNSVALSDDMLYAVVGAPNDDTVRGTDAGSARVFLRSGTTWAQQVSLLASDAAPGDDLGRSVAIAGDGSRILVGAPYDDESGTEMNAGCAYVFVRSGTTWTEEVILRAPLTDSDASDEFGNAVALSADGSRALVGAHNDDQGIDMGTGTARVFRRTGATWALETTLLPTDAETGDGFGDSVGLTRDATRAIIGAMDDIPPGRPRTGSARVYRRDPASTSWTYEQTLWTADGIDNDWLGSAVALADGGARAIVGSRRDDLAASAEGSARVFGRSGLNWSYETLLAAPDPANIDDFGQSVALSADGSRAIVGVPGDDRVVLGDNRGSARVFRLTAQLGDPCDGDGVCTTGFCTDEVCCSTRCAGGANDCQACSAGLTGAANGTCAALLAPIAIAVTCRASVDLCDPAEACVGGSTVCPPDALRPSGFTCRGAAPFCDVPELCDGLTPACPADAYAVAGAVCRAPIALCDAAETCTGSGTGCPADARSPTGTMCRPSGGACDPGEVCDGSSNACPGDALSPASFSCRSSAGACDASEFCTGLSALCPADVVSSAGTTCRVAMNGCDVVESCDGSTPMCPPDVFAPASTACGSSASGPCDGPDHCSGTSADCEAGFLTGVVCRAAVGSCDLEEVCAFGSAACPADQVLANGIPCRAAVGLCDVAEACTGSSPACPLDAVRPPGLVCRPTVPGGCDFPETCGGILPDCPPDLVEPSTTPCGPAPSGMCDAPDHCDGTLPTCAPTFLSGMLCRASTGACDLPESCSGASATCPTDSFAAMGFPCGGGTGGSCATGGTCDGSTTICPPSTLRPVGTVCLPAIAGNACDIADTCDGTTDVCQPRYAATGTTCDSAMAGPCDAPDVCAGTSADCIATFFSGVECRAGSGPCDVAEVCAGSTAACPPDLVVGAGLSCRISVDATCDPAEVCDGVAPSCPADVVTCGGIDSGAIDGGAVGTDSGTGLDSGSASVDAGAAPPAALVGCACRTGPSTRPGAIAGMLALGLVVAGRRRRSAG